MISWYRCLSIGVPGMALENTTAHFLDSRESPWVLTLHNS